jgi:hypothetical protein
MAYLGKVKRQRNFRVAPFVVQLDPKGFFGIRKIGSRAGFLWYKLEDLSLTPEADFQGMIVNPVIGHFQPLHGALEVGQ